MNEILKVSDDGRFRVRLVNDEDCESPRSHADGVIHVVTLPHSRYRNVDEAEGPLSEGWDRIKGHPDAVGIFERWAQIFHGAVTLFDTPSTGADAIWYILPEQFGEVSDPAKALKEERDEYREWAAGETYGYIIEGSAKWDRRDGVGELTTWGEVDSSYGYIGFDYARETALAALDQHVTVMGA